MRAPRSDRDLPTGERCHGQCRRATRTIPVEQAQPTRWSGGGRQVPHVTEAPAIGSGCLRPPLNAEELLFHEGDVPWGIGNPAPFQDLALILEDEIVGGPEELTCLHDLAVDHDLF